MGKCLSDRQVEKFHNDGFLSPINVFSINEASELKDKLEDAEKIWPEAFSASARNNAHLNFEFLDSIVHNKNLLDAVEDILGPNILAYASTLFIKEPRDPGFVSWHQDGKYMGLSENIGITAWVALSEANGESGCMSMIPGSHEKMLAHKDTFGKDNILTRGQEVQNVDAGKAVETPLRPGQASFHCPTVIHGSQPNRSEHRRIGFAIQTYIPTNVKSIHGRASAQLVRGIDTFGHFDLLQRPKRDMEEAQVTTRDRVNKEYADILYLGAKKTRDL
ncbi:MAG: phytanoyl-CoA dioxygenase family protein [Paracoccaceae bacterium]|nr:phytanoyl-CoA dioxygenase [Paracoccaceae bacterium]RZO38501.1 MAG: phytanoyl-CoA dioxygenase [Paracoccaceae bacterium]|tara:strand:- start:2336 stop:3163 length:828 start_codon:yes stop_codon:yes gene_type:complete